METEINKELQQPPDAEGGNAGTCEGSRVLPAPRFRPSAFRTAKESFLFFEVTKIAVISYSSQPQETHTEPLHFNYYFINLKHLGLFLFLSASFFKNFAILLKHLAQYLVIRKWNKWKEEGRKKGVRNGEIKAGLPRVLGAPHPWQLFLVALFHELQHAEIRTLTHLLPCRVPLCVSVPTAS